MKGAKFLVLFAAAAVALPEVVVAKMGSCEAAKKCCDGKDADCVVQDINDVIGGIGDEPCYCDHGCLEVGDCCPDFKDYCGGKY